MLCQDLPKCCSQTVSSSESLCCRVFYDFVFILMLVTVLKQFQAHTEHSKDFFLEPLEQLT